MGIASYLASPWTEPNRKQSAEGDSLFALDGIRGLAAVVVIASHAAAFGMGGQGARLGVLLFFCLSGFVLALPFVAHPERIFSPSVVVRFFANRALRIIPIFVVAVIFIRWLIDKNWAWAATNLTFAGGWTHLWSVAEEARFYVLFPLVIALLARLPWLIARILALVVLIAVAHHFQNAIMIDMMIHAVAPFYFWFFLAGMLACFLYRPVSAMRHGKFPLGVAAVIILLSIFLTSDGAVSGIWQPMFPSLPDDAALWISPEMWCAAFVVLLVSVTAFRGSFAGRFLQSYPMRQLGLMSYSLYLFHVPVLILLESYRLSGVSKFFAALAITYVVAVVSYLVVEKPFLMLKPKNHFFAEKALTTV